MVYQVFVGFLFCFQLSIISDFLRGIWGSDWGIDFSLELILKKNNGQVYINLHILLSGAITYHFYILTTPTSIDTILLYYQHVIWKEEIKMYALEQIKEYLKPAGWMIATNLKKEIKLVAEQVTDDEIVEGAAVFTRGLTGFKQYLGVITSKRILTTDKQKNFIAFDLDGINKFTINKKLTTFEVNFDYKDEAVQINIIDDDIGKMLLDNLKEKLRVFSTESNDSDQRKIVRVMKAIKMNIEILNGQEQLKQNGSNYKLAQTKPGTLEISADYNEGETFKIVKWERVENVQKSASSIVGWTVIGSKFGNAGAIAGAMGANIGKDKSVATLFLKRENGEKVPLVIKCDKKDLEKLSLLIVAEEEETTQAAPPSTTSSIPTDELIKLKELMDAGILTQEEFDAKKKQLLGI